MKTVQRSRSGRMLFCTMVVKGLNTWASIFFGSLFTRRLLETGANSRQAFIFTCTNFVHARVPFDAHGASAPDGKAKDFTALDGEAKAAGSHYMY